MEAHPIAERYPLMDGATYEKMKATIKARGLDIPIVRYKGKILDGRNRERACRELGIEPQYEDFIGTEDEAREKSDRLNFHRRHLTAEQRDQIIRDRRKRGEPIRKISSEMKVGHGTVQRAVAGVPTGTPAATEEPETTSGETADDLDGNTNNPTETKPTPKPIHVNGTPAPAPPKVKGRDGKSYPTTKKKPAAAAEPAATKKKSGRPPKVKTEPPYDPKVLRYAPRPRGVELGQAAVNALKSVPDNDPQRSDACRMVMSYLSAHYQEELKTWLSRNPF